MQATLALACSASTVLLLIPPEGQSNTPHDGGTGPGAHLGERAGRVDRSGGGREHVGVIV